MGNTSNNSNSPRDKSKKSRSDDEISEERGFEAGDVEMGMATGHPPSSRRSLVRDERILKEISLEMIENIEKEKQNIDNYSLFDLEKVVKEDWTVLKSIVPKETRRMGDNRIRDYVYLVHAGLQRCPLSILFMTEEMLNVRFDNRNLSSLLSSFMDPCDNKVLPTMILKRFRILLPDILEIKFPNHDWNDRVMEARESGFLELKHSWRRNLAVSEVVSVKLNPMIFKYAFDVLRNSVSFMVKLKEKSHEESSIMRIASPSVKSFYLDHKVSEDQKGRIRKMNKNKEIFREQSFDEEYEKGDIVELREKMKGMKFSDFSDNEKNQLQFLGFGANACVYSCNFPGEFGGIKGEFVVKIFVETEWTQEKKLECDRKESLYLPYHRNVVSILYHSVNEKIDIRNLSDPENKWRERLPTAELRENYACPIIVMNRCGVSLDNFISNRVNVPLDILEVCEILKGVITGAKHLHENGIVHGDLHLGNVLIDVRKGRVWIGDFGESLDLRKSVFSGKRCFKVKVKNVANVMLNNKSSTDLEDELFHGSSGPPELKTVKYGDEYMYLNYEKVDLYHIGRIGESLLPKIHPLENKNMRKKLRTFIDKFVIENLEGRIGYSQALREIKLLCEHSSKVSLYSQEIFTKDLDEQMSSMKKLKEKKSMMEMMKKKEK